MDLPGKPSTGKSIMVAVHGNATRYSSFVVWSSASGALSQPDRPIFFKPTTMSPNHAHNQVVVLYTGEEARGTLRYVP